MFFVFFVYDTCTHCLSERLPYYVILCYVLFLVHIYIVRNTYTCRVQVNVVLRTGTYIQNIGYYPVGRTHTATTQYVLTVNVPVT